MIKKPEIHLHRALGLISVTILLMASLSSCVHQPEDDDLTPDPNSTDTTGASNDGCDPDTVYFENDILPIILSSCAKAGCHDAATATEKVILDNYDNIIETGDVDEYRPDNSKLYEAITESKLDERMPPTGSPQLTSDEIQLIQKWILQGALNNKCDDDCDTLNVTYSSVIRPLVDKHCVKCHSGSSPQGGISLSSYSELKTQVDNNRLVGAVNRLPGYKAMPWGGAPLTNCELQQIQIWVDNGAPND